MLRGFILLQTVLRTFLQELLLQGTAIVLRTVTSSKVLKVKVITNKIVTSFD